MVNITFAFESEISVLFRKETFTIWNDSIRKCTYCAVFR